MEKICIIGAGDRGREIIQIQEDIKQRKVWKETSNIKDYYKKNDIRTIGSKGDDNIKEDI